MFDNFDLNNNGFLTFDEFLNILDIINNDLNKD